MPAKKRKTAEKRSVAVISSTPPGDYGETTAGNAVVKRDQHGITVMLDGDESGPRIPRSGQFDENLAELMTPEDRKALARRLKEYMEIDKESRKDWYDRGIRGLALMGVSDLPKSDKEGDVIVNSPGEANVKMPTMAEACTHFQSRAIAELCPATGPVKASIVGPRTKERVEQADRIETFGNYYLMTMDTGYFPDTDQMLMYLPMYGSVFRKAGQNWVTGLPELRHVKGENFIAPYAAKDLESATRYAHEYNLSGQDVRRAMESGMFVTVELKKPMIRTQTTQTADKSDNRMVAEHDDDANYPIAEYHIDLELPVDRYSIIRGKRLDESDRYRLLSYVIIVELENEEILMVRRNWKEKDKGFKRRIWFAHHKFFPGVGFYGWGYPHLLGSLQKAISDGVNALLDSGFAANFQGGFATKDAKAAGLTGDLHLEHGVWKQIDGTVEELSKALWSPDFKAPSMALAELVSKLLESFYRFASITEAAVGDADNRGPVGTTLALIEQSNIIPTAIHKRLHFSFGLELRMWAELVHDYMPNRYDYEIAKETKFLLREDFDGRVDIVPVSDPNIWSQKQRITLCQTVLEMQAGAPDLYQPQQRIEAHRRLMQAMRVPDMEAVAPQLSQPKYMDAAGENAILMTGGAVQAFEEQDHPAHLTILAHGKKMLVMSPAFASLKPEKQEVILAGFDTHAMDHVAMHYRRLIMQASQLPPPPSDGAGNQEELPPDIEAQITAAVLQRLPALPPPPAQPGDEAAQAAALDAKSQAEIKAKADQAAAQIERDTEAFVAEQGRLEEAHQAELRRKDEAAATQVMREGAKAEVQLDAKQREAELKLQSKDQEHQQKLQHADVAVSKDLEHKDKKVDQELQHKDAKTGQDLSHKDATHDQSLTHADKATQQKLSAAEQQAKQKRDVTEGDAKQKRRHAATDHRQKLSQADESHKITQQHAQEDHEKLIERGDQSHKQSLKQTGQSGKLKVQQTKQQMAAKKKATKKQSKK